MMARRIPTILPDMSPQEQLETTMIYSVAGLLDEGMPVARWRPFQVADYRTTRAGLLGGGVNPYPGQVSLAHNGVLFIDEFLEMDKRQIDALRKPMEEARVQLIRKGVSYTFPARFMLASASNPCRCGYYGDKHHTCTCTQTQIDQYQSRLSGPVADRIDLFIPVYPVDFQTLQAGEEKGSSERLKEKVLKGRERQRQRFQGTDISFNSQMEERHIRRFIELGREETGFLQEACQKYHLSTRRYYKLIRVARTVADIDGSDDITMYHLAAAFRYTMGVYGREKGE
jgi:magnesium chelatase family protein